MSNHTPGPWSVVDGHYPSMINIAGPSFGISIVTSATDLDFDDYLMRTADAHLIAAAPELLAALEACIKYGSMTGDQWVAEKAMDAIAKARGES